MRRTISLLKVCTLLVGFLMLSAMSGCPRESGEGAGGESSEIGGSSGTGGGSGY
jgi:hypothetical protein